MSDTDRGSKKKRQKVSKDDVEQSLEEILFGNERSAGVAPKKGDEGRFASQSELAFTIDRGALRQPVSSAWIDEDDADLTLDITQTDRLKKFKYSKARGGSTNSNDEGEPPISNLLTGHEMTSVLRERYQMREVQWAMTSTEDNSETADILNQTDSMLASGDDKSGLALPKGRVQLQRVMDANASDPAQDNVTCCQFSSSGELIVVGSTDRWIRVFKLGEEDKSEKVLATRFNEMPILDAKIRGHDSAELLVTGRKPYFYSYDLESGVVTKVRSLVGSGKNINSHEKMSVCPDGSKIVFAGAGGYIHMLSGQQKTWMMDIKMNTAVRALSFSSDTMLVSAGLDADIYTWDIRNTSRCVSRVRNEDGASVSSIVSVPSSTGDFVTAIGSESGVVTLYNTHCHYTESKGIPGLADYRAVALSSVAHKSYRDVMNLTTKITSMAVHPTGQMLAIASDQKRDQLRLIHTASGTVFENWPTDNTPLRRVQCIDFSPVGDYLAIGNNRGRVLLYKLNHFRYSSN